MKKLLSISLIVVLIVVAVSCHKTAVAPQGTVYLDLPATTDQYFPNGSIFYNERATLGRVLFYDGHLSVNNAIACASCHKQNYGFADNVPLSTGFDGRLTKRNSQGLHNLVASSNIFSLSNIIFQQQPFFWDGRENILENLVDRPITNHVEMGITDTSLLPAKLSGLPIYGSLFFNAYGDSNITSTRISECISIFMSAIVSNKSRFTLSRQLFDTLNSLETEGENLFMNKYNCGNCHHVITNVYTEDDFKDIGLDKNYTDLGLGGLDHFPTNNGKFRVPSLDNVALTAPYMHDGRFQTLSDVIDHYSHGICNSPNLDPLLQTADNQPIQMNISDQEKAALIAFLNTFTDYTTILDPKFSNPFKIKN